MNTPSPLHRLQNCAFRCVIAALASVSVAHAQVSGTGLQSPLPPPALPLPKDDKPVLTSPPLKQLPVSMQGRPLTIDDVVAIALSTNRTLALQFEAFLQAKGVTTTARAGLGPTVTANYIYDAYNSAVTSAFGTQVITIQEQYTSQYLAVLSLPIDITGELRAALSQAKYLELAARLDINRARNEVVLNTKTAFYAVLRAQAIVKVAEDALQNAYDRLADTQLRLDAGTAAKFDVVTAKSDVATADQTLIADRNSLSQAFASLNNTIGIDVDTPLELTTEGAVELPNSANTPFQVPNLKPTKPPENDLQVGKNGLLGDAGDAQADAIRHFTVSNPLPPNDQFAGLLNEAMAKRPEILREDADVSAARKGLQVARAGYLPSLTVGYDYSYTPDVGVLGQSSTGYGSLTLSIPIFDSGATRGKVDQARAQLASAQVNKRTEVDAITLELRQAYLNLQSAELSLPAARQALAQADEAYQLARLRYTTGITSKPGVSPIVEFSDAQQTLSQAQSNYVNALYDYNNYRSALDKALGRYSYTTAKLGFAVPPTLGKVGAVK